MDYGQAARDALHRHGFRFTHSLGQNFLLDSKVICRIADAAGVCAGANVLEIGAGAGVLTAEMLKRGANVRALEIDRTLEPVLHDVLGDCRAIVFEDALKCDLAALTRDAFGGAAFMVVANLPYYITADILLRLVTLKLPIASITVMVQKEACERIMARPGQKAYSALAATLQYHGSVRVLMRVGPSAFTPPPHVDSVLMRIEPYETKPVQAADDAMMHKVIGAAFAMRRKTLLNNVVGAFAITRDEAQALLEAEGIDPRVRGEALPLTALAQIANALSKYLNVPPA